MQAGMREALDLVDVVIRHQLARRVTGQIVGTAQPGDRGTGEREMLRIERGVRLVVDPRLDAYLVDAVGRSAPGDRLRLGHRNGGERYQLVRPLEIVVLQRRVVDLPREGGLCGGVVMGGVEV